MSRQTETSPTRVNSYTDLRKDDSEYASYASRLTERDIESLCKILQHPAEKIFTENNLPIDYTHNSYIQVGKERYCITSWRMNDILCGIKDGKWNKDDVLRDIEVYCKNLDS
jgi:hypothetical protein